MGVSGSGKSTVGELLAQQLGCSYVDGDDLHPESNIAKMSAGTPLTDADRWPWLSAIGQLLVDERAGVVGCSALKRAYRDHIRSYAPDVVFVHVHGTPELLRERMKQRSGHFMPDSLLDSQLATLEPLEADETGRVFDIAAPPEQIAADAAAWIRG